jgi:hypothetical protein
MKLNRCKMLVITSLSGRSGYYCRRAARWYLSAAAAACAKINWPPLSASIKANEKESVAPLRKSVLPVDSWK